ncbi:MAG: hypothetical protein IJY43_06900 [Clostridia bacterium]|nr:hypothetical protein [Clostridia bacterium]
MDSKAENRLPKRKGLRLKQYDYSSRGAYFVTICVKDRKPILSAIEKPVGVGALDDPQIRLTEIGKTVEKHLLSSEKISGVTIDQYVIMPDHLHIIIFLDPDLYPTQVMTTSRAGGLHKPPWGISPAEPIGSSNDPPLAEVAPLPQMWQLSFSLPCVNGNCAA